MSEDEDTEGRMVSNQTARHMEPEHLKELRRGISRQLRRLRSNRGTIDSDIKQCKVLRPLVVKSHEKS